MIPDADLNAMVETGNRGALRATLLQMHPADIARFVDDLTDENRLFVFYFLSNPVAAEVLDEAQEDTTETLVKGTEWDRMSRVVEQLEADDAAELIADLSDENAAQLLQSMPDEAARDLKDVLAYGEESAGRLMTTTYVTVRHDHTVREALDGVRRQIQRADDIYYLYVIDASDTLVGVVSLRALVAAPLDIDVGLICDPDVVRVSAHTDRELVAQSMAKYDLLAIPVVDDNGHLVGMITIDDAVDVLTEEAVEDLLRVSGSFEESTSGRPRLFGPVFYRLPWLLVTVVGELAVGLLMSSYIDQIQRLIVLALFIPIVTATAGSVGVQSLAATLGAFQEGRPPSHPVRRALRETRYGLMLGLASGLVAGALAYGWQLDPWLGLHIGVSMTLSLTLAAGLGSAVPLALGRFGVDPTIASGPLITTINDALSLAIYLGLAGVFLVGA